MFKSMAYPIFAVLVVLSVSKAFALDKSAVLNLHTPLGSSPTLESARWSARTAKGDDPMTISEKKACRDANLAECPTFTDLQLGSVFFLEPDLILTTLHGFKDYMRARLAIEPTFKNVQVPVTIYADGGRIVFGNQPNDFARITPLLDAAQTSVENDSLDSDLENDLAYVRLSRPIGKPVTVSRDTLSVGQSVTAIGYTNDDQTHANYFRGEVVQKPSDSPCKTSEAGYRKIQYASYSNESGMSGAPVINAAGEVIGVHLGNCASQGARYSLFMPISEILP